MSREPSNPVPDTQGELRTRLASHLSIGGPDALDRIAQRTSLWPDAVAAFARGSLLAQWAAERVAHALDQDQAAKREPRGGQ